MYKLILSDSEIEFLLGAVKRLKIDIHEPATPRAIREIYRGLLAKLKDPEEHEESRLITPH